MSQSLADALESAMTSLVEVVTPPDVFRVLLDATTIAAPRGFLVLRRGGAWKGWGSSGYVPEAARRLREQPPVSDSWLDGLEGPEWLPRTAPPGSGEPAIDFGQPAPEETEGFALRVGDNLVAAIVIERQSDEDPWQPSALAALVLGAQMRLELDLTQRRARPVAAPAVEPPAPEPVPAPSRAPVAAERSAEPAASTAPSAASEMAPWRESRGTAAVEDRRYDDARRYARLVATDIRLYNEEAVMLGRRNRDLSRRLAEPLERGRESFQKRFHELGPEAHRILRDAYVQVLGGGEESLFPLE